MNSKAAVRDHRDSELAIFFEQSLDLLCVANFDGYFTRLNSAWTTHLGWSIEELLARPFVDFIHPDDLDPTLAELANLSEGVQTISFENRYRRRDGVYCWLQWNARPMPGSQRIYATARDVTRQKQLERQVLKISDREKERFGQELHDGLCQTLAGIAALSSTLSRKLAATPETEASNAAAEIAQMLNDAIGGARDLARGLGPVGLRTAGLDGVLESHVSAVNRLFAASCTFECDRPLRPIHLDVKSHLFRIAQEAVNNALSHSGGSEIEIRLSTGPEEGLLSIQDNGNGFADSGHSSGIGMHTMSYRARLIGAALEVRSRAPSGTMVTCRFPLSKAGA